MYAIRSYYGPLRAQYLLRAIYNAGLCIEPFSEASPFSPDTDAQRPSAPPSAPPPVTPFPASASPTRQPPRFCANQAFPLSDRFLSALTARHYSPRTIDAYLKWMVRFKAFFPGKDITLAGEKEINAFLTDMAVRDKVAASTQNQA